jgi:Terminase RNaseH-like domain
MERSSALYHVQRIHSMTRGLRIPIAWPHDGAQHDKGSGLPLSQQYKNFGANMMARHAHNHGTDHNNVEPALEELRELMFHGKLIIAGHNNELLEEMRHYHRDEDFRLVKQRDDLVSALRYSTMMRRHGKARSECEGVGFGPMPYARQQRDRSESRRWPAGSTSTSGQGGSDRGPRISLRLFPACASA